MKSKPMPGPHESEQEPVPKEELLQTLWATEAQRGALAKEGKRTLRTNAARDADFAVLPEVLMFEDRIEELLRAAGRWRRAWPPRILEDRGKPTRALRNEILAEAGKLVSAFLVCSREQYLAFVKSTKLTRQNAGPQITVEGDGATTADVPLATGASPAGALSEAGPETGSIEERLAEIERNGGKVMIVASLRLPETLDDAIQHHMKLERVLSMMVLNEPRPAHGQSFKPSAALAAQKAKVDEARAHVSNLEKAAAVEAQKRNAEDVAISRAQAAERQEQQG